MPSEIFVRRIDQNEEIEFECGDDDLTSFFRDDCRNYLKQFLAVTYAIEFQEEIVAMFSLCNDRLDIHDFGEDRKKLKHAANDIPHPKRNFKNFPAVKIARLAVKNGIQKKGIGTSIVSFIQVLFILKNKTGCRFLTVDAYPAAIGFYEKVGFKKVEKNPKEDSKFESTAGIEGSDHVLMFFDLAIIRESQIVTEFGTVVEELLQSNKAPFVKSAAINFPSESA